MRSGGILLEAVRRIAPDSKTAKILIQRDEATAEPKLFYAKLPPDVAELHGLRERRRRILLSELARALLDLEPAVGY